jgi:outer membrane protein assembly factor BamE (lipoprotein component of BamABCDE complex)
MSCVSGRGRAVLVAVVCVLGIPVAGCGLFSHGAKSPAPAEVAAQPTPIPASPIPVPRRGADGRIADEELLKQLVQGKTTKDQVRAVFGTPQEVVRSPGTETFLYYRDKTSGWIFRTSDRVEMLTVRFDDKGILKDFEYRYSGK